MSGSFVTCAECTKRQTCPTVQYYSGRASGCSKGTRTPQEATAGAGVSGQGVPPDSAGNAKAGGKAGRIEARYVYLVLRGQVRGGKNNMGVTKTGIHYPQKPWKLWRDAMLAQLQEQRIGPTICEPCAAEINYYAGDRKRRDLPAILDAIWHVLERGGVVKDDSLIKSVNLKGGYDKTHPRAVIRLTVMDASEQDQTP